MAVAIPLIAVAGASAAGVAFSTALTIGALASSVAGLVTGNEDLTKIGAFMGIASAGLGLANAASGAAGAAASTAPAAAEIAAAGNIGQAAATNIGGAALDAGIGAAAGEAATAGLGGSAASSFGPAGDALAGGMVETAMAGGGAANPMSFLDAGSYGSATGEGVTSLLSSSAPGAADPSAGPPKAGTGLIERLGNWANKNQTLAATGLKAGADFVAGGIRGNLERDKLNMQREQYAKELALIDQKLARASNFTGTQINMRPGQGQAAPAAGQTGLIMRQLS